MHGAEAFDAALDGDGTDAGDVEAIRARGEHRGLVEIVFEEFGFVAAEGLNAGASDGGVRLGEEFDLRAVGEREPGFADAAFDEIGESVPGEEIAEVRVHALGLVETAAEDSDLDSGLVEEIESGGDGAEEGLAAASSGPDDAVDGLRGRIERIVLVDLVVELEAASALEEGVGEIVEGGLVGWDDGGGRELEFEEVAEPGGELGAVARRDGDVGRMGLWEGMVGEHEKWPKRTRSARRRKG